MFPSNVVRIIADYGWEALLLSKIFLPDHPLVLETVVVSVPIFIGCANAYGQILWCWNQRELDVRAVDITTKEEIKVPGLKEWCCNLLALKIMSPFDCCPYTGDLVAITDGGKRRCVLRRISLQGKLTSQETDIDCSTYYEPQNLAWESTSTLVKKDPLAVGIVQRNGTTPWIYSLADGYDDTTLLVNGHNIPMLAHSFKSVMISNNEQWIATMSSRGDALVASVFLIPDTDAVNGPYECVFHAPVNRPAEDSYRGVRRSHRDMMCFSPDSRFFIMAHENRDWEWEIIRVALRSPILCLA